MRINALILGLDTETSTEQLLASSDEEDEKEDAEEGTNRGLAADPIDSATASMSKASNNDTDNNKALLSHLDLVE